MGGWSPSSLDAAFLKELGLGFCCCYSLGFTNPFASVMYTEFVKVYFLLCDK